MPLSSLEDIWKPDDGEWTINRERTFVFVYTYPNNMLPSELAVWIFERFRLNVINVNTRDIIRARNQAMIQATKIAPQYEHIVFVDNDVRPDSRADEMFKLDTDVKCCRVKMGNQTAWDKPGAFHDPLWCIDRYKLASIPPPYITGWGYNESHTEYESCMCQGFQKKAESYGLTFGSAGYAPHENSGSWCG